MRLGSCRCRGVRLTRVGGFYGKNESLTDAASLLNLNLLGICAVACHSKPQVYILFVTGTTCTSSKTVPTGTFTVCTRYGTPTCTHVRVHTRIIPQKF